MEVAVAELARFSTLQRSVSDSVAEYIRAGGEPAEAMIRMLVDCEHDYINYDHPLFIGGPNAVADVLSERRARRVSKTDLGPKEQAAEGGTDGGLKGGKAEGNGRPTGSRNVRGAKDNTTAGSKLGLKVCISFCIWRLKWVL